MKKIIFPLIALFLPLAIMAQDFIYKNDGSEIQSKVVEITPDFIKYKKYSYLDGPTYNININEVFMIVYENGDKEIFKKQEVSNPLPEEQSPEQVPVLAKPTDVTTHPANNPKPAGQPVLPQPEPAANTHSSNAPNQPAANVAFKPRTSIGIAGGFCIASAHYNYKEGVEPPSGLYRIGPAFGIMLDMEVSRYFSIQSGIYYRAKGDKVDMKKFYEKFNLTDVEAEGTLKSNLTYLEAPLALVIGFPAGTYQVQIGAGPFVAYGISGKEKEDYSVKHYQNGNLANTIDYNNESAVVFVDNVPESTEDGKVYTKSFDYGLFVHFGIKARPFILSASLSAGLANPRPGFESNPHYNPADESTKTVTSCLTLTYLFGDK